MTKSRSQTRALIVGGGIGGLTTALALARNGMGAMVLERPSDEVSRVLLVVHHEHPYSIETNHGFGLRCHGLAFGLSLGAGGFGITNIIIGRRPLRLRPSRSVLDVDARSVRKKMKDKAFARGVSREDILTGAEELGVALDEHIAFVIGAMQRAADALGLSGER